MSTTIQLTTEVRMDIQAKCSPNSNTLIFYKKFTLNSG